MRRWIGRFRWLWRKLLRHANCAFFSGSNASGPDDWAITINRKLSMSRIKKERTLHLLYSPLPSIGHEGCMDPWVRFHWEWIKNWRVGNLMLNCGGSRLPSSSIFDHVVWYGVSIAISFSVFHPRSKRQWRAPHLSHLLCVWVHGKSPLAWCSTHWTKWTRVPQKQSCTRLLRDNLSCRRHQWASFWKKKRKKATSPLWSGGGEGWKTRTLPGRSTERNSGEERDGDECMWRRGAIANEPTERQRRR